MSEEKIEEETYSLIFKSLKHPIRRKILRALVNRQLAFSEILDFLSIDSGHLSYHIENLGDLVKHSLNGKYELSSVGTAAVNLMSGVEERPQLLTLTGKLGEKKIRNVLMGSVLVILVASVALNAYFFNSSQTHFNSLQARLKENLWASRDMAISFKHCVDRATSIRYLLWRYATNVEYLLFKYGGAAAVDGYSGAEPNEDNIEPLIEGFFSEMWYSYDFLRGLRDLHPELSEYEKPLYFIDRFIHYTIIEWESFTGGPTVQSVFSNLLDQAGRNYSLPLIAFKELNQTSFHKIEELAFEVAESFAPFNATRLDNTVNIIEELQGILGQWIDKYSQM